MWKRVLTALVGIPLVVIPLYLGGIFFQVLVAVLVVIGLWEYGTFLRDEVCWDYLLVAGLSLLFVAYTDMGGLDVFGWFVWQTGYFLVRASFTSRNPLALAPNMLGVFYVAGFFSFLWLLRSEMGVSWVLFALLTTWATDSGAYLAGRTWGRHRLAPALSPKKTLEGAAGGVLFAMAIGLAFAYYQEISLVYVLVLSVLLSVVGQTGDLVESAMKRERDVKDSGNLLPGHGGILDRFDSLMFVLPVLYFILKYS